MLIPQALIQKIEARLEEFISDPSPCVAKFDEPIDVRKVAAELRILPLIFEMGGCYALRSNGEVVSFSWDDPYNVEVENDARIRNSALFQGSQKYPELSELVPPRPQDARDCSYCKGTGIVQGLPPDFPMERIVCYCGGLGWVP
jgi:hypothetical protein